MIKSLVRKLLLHFGSYLKLDAHYFVKGGAWGMLQQIVGIASGLTVSYLFGHFISKHLFGEYNLILSIISLFTFLSLPGIDTALVRSVGQGYDASLLQSQSIKIKFSVITIPVLLCVSIFYFIKGNFPIGSALVIASFAFPFLYSFSSYSSFLTAKKQFIILAIVSSLASLFFLISTAVSIFLFPSVSGLTTGYLIGSIIPAIIAFYYCKKFIQSKKIDIHLPNYGSFLTIVSVLPWLSGNTGSIILGNLVGPESLAIYSVSLGFLVSVQKNFVVFYKPVNAKLASQSREEHLETLKKHGFKFFIIGVFLSFLLWLIMPFLVKFFFTTTYNDAIRYGQWLSLALIPLPISWVLSDIMIYQKNKRAQVLMSTVPHVLKIILYFVFIPLWGINGLVSLFILERYSEPIIPLLVLWHRRNL